MEGSVVRTHLANLDDPDDSVRHKAYLSLMDSPPTPAWVPELVAAATNGAPDVRRVAGGGQGPRDADQGAHPRGLGGR